MLNWKHLGDLKIVKGKSIANYRADFKGSTYLISECISGGFYMSVMGDPSVRTEFFAPTLDEAKRLAELELDVEVSFNVTLAVHKDKVEDYYKAYIRGDMSDNYIGNTREDCINSAIISISKHYRAKLEELLK